MSGSGRGDRLDQAPLPLRLYVLLVILAGTSAALAVLTSPGAWSPTHALLPALLALATASRTVPVPGTGVRLNADTPFLLVLVYLDAPREAVLLSGLNMAIATWRSGMATKRLYTAPFNAAAGFLGGAAAVITWDLLRGAGIDTLAAVPAAALAMFVANSAAVLGVLRLVSGGKTPQSWLDGLGMTALAYLASGTVGWLLAQAPGWIGMAVLAAPVFGLMVHAFQSNRRKEEERLQRVRERDEVFLPTLEALVAGIEARDIRTHGHHRRVHGYAVGLADAMGLVDEEVRIGLRYGSLLHDIGKIAIPDSLLLADRALTPEERERMRQHVIIGADLIRHVPFPPGVIDVVRHHHERWDGGGYPDGLTAEAIPLAARIVNLVDVFDDMLNAGSRAEPLSREEALERIQQESGTAFDPVLVEAFVAWQREQEEQMEGTTWNAASEAIHASSREQARLHELAYEDALTGLRNGRALKEDLARWAEEGDLGVLMLDLDGFKGLNDHYGHDLGDVALKLVGRAMLSLEGADRACYRNGGDEFVVLLPGARDEDLQAHVDAVRDAVESERLFVDDRRYIPLKTSIGAASLHRPTAEALLKAADTSMYADKARRKDGRPRGAAPELVEVAA